MAIQFYAWWDGQRLAPDMRADRDSADRLPRKKLVKVSAHQARSPSHHRALFAALAVVHTNWPAGHPFQTDDPGEFRAWITVAAGHAIKTRIAFDAGPEATKVLKNAYALERRHGNYVWIFLEEEGMAVIARPKTIRWTAVDQAEFRMVFDAIARVIMREAGIDLGQVIDQLREKGKNL